MPYSYNDFDHFLKTYIPERCKVYNADVIDVGAGAGKYGDLLKGKCDVWAIEVWKEYIQKYDLASKYMGVLLGDVRWFTASTFADKVVIMGDVFEHLTVEDAKKVLETMQYAYEVVIVVPYLYEQGPDHPDVKAFGNPYEVHHQPDLTHEVFLERYPQFICIGRNPRCGVYVWRIEKPEEVRKAA